MFLRLHFWKSIPLRIRSKGKMPNFALYRGRFPAMLFSLNFAYILSVSLGGTIRWFKRFKLVQVSSPWPVLQECFTMSCTRKSASCAFVILSLSMFNAVQLAEANEMICTGEYNSAKDCGGIFLQGFPIDPKDCSTTCETHSGHKHVGCVDANSYAANHCGAGKHAVVSRTFPSHDGNKCGYGWFSIICQ